MSYIFRVGRGRFEYHKLTNINFILYKFHNQFKILNCNVIHFKMYKGQIH